MAEAAAFADKDPTRISWNQDDYNRMANGQLYELREDMIRRSLYRPFFKQRVVFDRTLIQRTYRLPSLYPTPESANVGISIVGSGTTVPFGCLATNTIINLDLLSHSCPLRTVALRGHIGRSDRTDAVGQNTVGARLQPQLAGRRALPHRAWQRPDRRRRVLLRLRHPPLPRLPPHLRVQPEEREATHPVRHELGRSSMRSPPLAASFATSTSATRRSSRTRSPKNGQTGRTRRPTPIYCSSVTAR